MKMKWQNIMFSPLFPILDYFQTLSHFFPIQDIESSCNTKVHHSQEEQCTSQNTKSFYLYFL